MVSAFSKRTKNFKEKTRYQQYVINVNVIFWCSEFSACFRLTISKDFLLKWSRYQHDLFEIWRRNAICPPIITFYLAHFTRRVIYISFWFSSFQNYCCAIEGIALRPRFGSSERCFQKHFLDAFSEVKLEIHFSVLPFGLELLIKLSGSGHENAIVKIFS